MNKKLYIISLITFGFFQNVNAENLENKGSVLTSPLVVAMLSMAIVLFFIILVLTNIIKVTTKTKLREIKNKLSTKALSLIVLLLGVSSLNAQETKVGLYEDAPISGMHPWTFYILFATIILFLFVIFWLSLSVLKSVTKREEKEAILAGETVVKESAFAKFFTRKVLGVKPVTSDKDVLLDHDYDGIKELDNDLPPWWKYGFYLTIISGIIYLFGYHVTGSFKSSLEEYNAEVAEGEKAENEYRLKMALNVDETNVVFLTEADKIEAGKATFMKNCIVCHGNEGQGNTIGPNLTDKYWIYGGHAKNLFTTVKNGANNGMKAWKDELSPTQIQEVISYIHTLQGTNPANPKAPQGNLFEDLATGTDSTSNSTTLPVDSMKIIETKI